MPGCRGDAEPETTVVTLIRGKVARPAAPSRRTAWNSPDGLSIEMTDSVDYDVQLLDHGKVKTQQHVRSRYVIVLTPAEVQWRVRVFQAEPD